MERHSTWSKIPKMINTIIEDTIIDIGFVVIELSIPKKRSNGYGWEGKTIL